MMNLSILFSDYILIWIFIDLSNTRSFVFTVLKLIIYVLTLRGRDLAWWRYSGRSMAKNSIDQLNCWMICKFIIANLLRWLNLNRWRICFAQRLRILRFLESCCFFTKSTFWAENFLTIGCKSYSPTLLSKFIYFFQLLTLSNLLKTIFHAIIWALCIIAFLRANCWKFIVSKIRFGYVINTLFIFK